MRIRVVSLAAVVLAVMAGMNGFAQSQAANAKSNATNSSKVPRTPWGDPDLQGTWDYRTITPLERNRELGTRAFYTDEERKALEDRAGKRMDTAPEKITPGLNHAQWWTDPGRFVSDGYRTSLVVDPPDGRIPPLTAE